MEKINLVLKALVGWSPLVMFILLVLWASFCLTPLWTYFFSGVALPWTILAIIWIGELFIGVRYEWKVILAVCGYYGLIYISAFCLLGLISMGTGWAVSLLIPSTFLSAIIGNPIVILAVLLAARWLYRRLCVR